MLSSQLHWPGRFGTLAGRAVVDASSLTIQELVRACADGDTGAWQEFVARTQPVVARACLRAARQWGRADAHSVEDFVQETYAKLVKGQLLASLVVGEAGAVFGYLKVLATRLVHDHCKAQAAAKRGGRAPVLGMETADADASPEACGEAECEAAVLLSQIEDCVAGVASAREVNRTLLMFQLYYRAGLSAAAIASIPCLNATEAGVEDLVQRLQQKIQETHGAAV